jgi:hypothetical protein
LTKPSNLKPFAAHAVTHMAGNVINGGAGVTADLATDGAIAMVKQEKQ